MSFMKYEQLEFDFVTQIKRKRNWFTEHFRPTVGWADDPHEQTEDKWNNLNNIWENVIDHIRIGFSLTWKF